MRKSGFTIVELIITITIMAILMTFAVVNLRSSQINARDSERKNDVQTIARGLEQRYNNGLAQPTDSTTITAASGGTFVDPSNIVSLTEGSYPSLDEINYLTGANSTVFKPNPAATSYITEDLPGTDPASFVAPGDNGKFTGANLATVTTAEVGNNYVYVPRAIDNSVCVSLTTQCTSFNLYYVTEIDSAVQTVQSKHQQ